MRTNADYKFMYGHTIPFSSLKGKTLTGFQPIDDRVSFITKKGKYTLINFESWCGNDCEVTLEDIDGDISRLFNQKILLAEETTDQSKEGVTYSFYKLSTNNDSVTLRFYGRSNGYYSESMGLYKE